MTDRIIPSIFIENERLSDAEIEELRAVRNALRISSSENATLYGKTGTGQPSFAATV